MGKGSRVGGVGGRRGGSDDWSPATVPVGLRAEGRPQRGQSGSPQTKKAPPACSQGPHDVIWGLSAFPSSVMGAEIY